MPTFDISPNKISHKVSQREILNALKPEKEKEFTRPKEKVKKRNSKKILFFLALIALGLIFFAFIYLEKKGEEPKKLWQAVFLSNGQVYFGHVLDEKADPVVLQEIYYLQVIQPLQQTSQGEGSLQLEPELSLVKLGNELHGPRDEMRIVRANVLFIEDLKDNGKVVEAIRRHKEEQKGK